MVPPNPISHSKVKKSKGRCSIIFQHHQRSFKSAINAISISYPSLNWDWKRTDNLLLPESSAAAAQLHLTGYLGYCLFSVVSICPVWTGRTGILWVPPVREHHHLSGPRRRSFFCFSTSVLEHHPSQNKAHSNLADLLQGTKNWLYVKPDCMWLVLSVYVFSTAIVTLFLLFLNLVVFPVFTMFSLLDSLLCIWDMWPINSLNKYSNLPEEKKDWKLDKKMGQIPSVLAHEKRPWSVKLKRKEVKKYLLSTKVENNCLREGNRV